MSFDISAVNQVIPLQSMWDGFWIHQFSEGELIISCSFNRIYYRDFDIIFTGVTFFNLPEEWRDTDVPGDELIHISSPSAFDRANPGFNTDHKLVLAIDLIFPTGQGHGRKLYTFFIVCDSVTAERCKPGYSSPVREYTDPLEHEPYPCMSNRVPLFPG